MSENHPVHKDPEGPGILTWMPLLIGVALAVGLIGGAALDGEIAGVRWSPAEEGVRGDLNRLEEIIRYTDHRYVDEFSEDSLSALALDAFLGSLDPFSDYIQPGELDRLEEESEGHYHGIGLEFQMIRDTVTVLGLVGGEVPPIDAAIRPGDRILSVDGKAVSGTGRPIGELTRLMRGGDHQEKARLEILPLDGSAIRTVDLGRTEISVISVSCAYPIDTETDYIRLDRFNGNAYRDFMEAMEGLRNSESEKRHLILDLRGNPGGYLQEAVKIASQLFEQEDRLIVYTEGAHSERNEYRSTGRPFYQVGRLAVLIDRYSASGSEVLAGAIQDWDRGVIIGEGSFGKGLVQEQYELQNGGAIRLTTAKYFTPSGRSIQRPYPSIGNKVITTPEDTVQEEADLFKSRLHKRPLPNGQGIQPDISISSKDTLSFDHEKVVVVAFDWLRARRPEIIASFAEADWLNKVEQIEMITDPKFRSICSVHWRELSEGQMKTLARTVLAEVVRFQKGEMGRRMFLNLEDPVLQEAARRIKAGDPMESL